MKRTFQLIALLFALIFSFNSCDTRVDLFADYKDIPIVYGLLDASQDTNYVKIIRAFCNSNENPVSANELALIADSNNYPGTLDARLIELMRLYGNHYEPTGREIILNDTILHYKVPGPFYYPDQKIYYTTERLKSNSNNHNYKYRLQILKGTDTISAVTGMVGGDKFKIVNSSIGFDPYSSEPKSFPFTPADNAFVYSAKMRFEYSETWPGHPWTKKSIEWSLGTYTISDLNLVDGCYNMKYINNSMFNHLSAAIGGDTLNATRHIGDFYIMIAAGADVLYNYIEINTPSGGISQNVPDYTNIDGGYGLFSSRLNISKKVSLSSPTTRKLISMSGWGFAPGDDPE